MLSTQKGAMWLTASDKLETWLTASDKLETSAWRASDAAGSDESAAGITKHERRFPRNPAYAREDD
jgi:hypothetical protein